MGKDLNSIEQCKQKIKDIYKVINSQLNIEKIIFTTRTVGYMYGIGYGAVDGGNKKPYSGSKFEEYFKDKNNWHQKQQFLNNIENEFKVYNNSKKQFYYLMENPELGFDPKNCMIRPFGIFQSTCRLKLEDYLKRSSEYRNFIQQISSKYKNVIVLDPKNLYCDDKYCYAVKDGKMLYADDDHHSVDGSIEQVKYFESKVFNAN
jgi:hypothetical protein